MRSSFNGIALCVACVIAIPTLSRAAPPADKAAKSAPAATPAPQMRAYIDPETGKLIDHPVTEEQKRAATQATKTAAPAKVQEIRHVDGSIETILNGAADAQLTATVGKDGKIRYECSDATHHHALDQALTQAGNGDER